MTVSQYKNFLIDKALKNLKKAEQAIIKAEENDIPVSTGVLDLQEERRKLEALRSKRITSKNSIFGKLEEAAKQRTYYTSFIKYGYEVADKSRETENVKPTTTEYLSNKQIAYLKRKQVEKPESLTREQISILRQYSQRNQIEFNKKAEANDIEAWTDEQADAFIQKFKVSRDLSAGGSSKLLNDLFNKVYDTNYRAARELVEYIQDLMSDPKMFIRIEAWYRGQTDLQRELDSAESEDWYEAISSLARKIGELMDTLQNDLGVEMPADLRRKVDEFANEHMGLYEH